MDKKYLSLIKFNLNYSTTQIPIQLCMSIHHASNKECETNQDGELFRSFLERKRTNFNRLKEGLHFNFYLSEKRNKNTRKKDLYILMLVHAHKLKDVGKGRKGLEKKSLHEIRE